MLDCARSYQIGFDDRELALCTGFVGLDFVEVLLSNSNDIADRYWRVVQLRHEVAFVLIEHVNEARASSATLVALRDAIYEVRNIGRSVTLNFSCETVPTAVHAVSRGVQVVVMIHDCGVASRACGRYHNRSERPVNANDGQGIQ